MHFLLLSLFLMIAPARAQKSLSPHVFQSNVRPVLTGIVNDFYQMISLFPDFPQDIVVIVGQMEELEGYKEVLQMDCPRQLTDKCLSAVDNLRGRLALVEAKTLRLWSGLGQDNSPYMTAIIGMRLISKFKTELFAFKGGLDNASFLMRAKIKEPKGTYALIKKMDELKTLLSLAVVEFVPFLYKEDFRTFYFSFVHPIQAQLHKNKNYKFFHRNVNRLNFAINLLNQNLTKRNKKTPEGMAPYLSLIHNRWNSLLRYYL